MHDLVKTILRILDGTPRRSGPRHRGQSLVELALVTPLLIIMVVGIVEIGWYANHYLILLEVTRVGARAGTVLTGDLSPTQWVEQATNHPVLHLMDEGYDTSPSGVSYDGLQVSGEIGENPNAESLNYRDCNPDIVNRHSGFYNFIACAMIESLEPLELRGRAANSADYIPKRVQALRSSRILKIPFPDDIVISVFSIHAVNNADPATVSIPLESTDPFNHRLWTNIYARTLDFENAYSGAAAGVYPPGFQTIIVGRYPRGANECNVWFQPDNPDDLEDSYIHRVMAPLAEIDPDAAAAGNDGPAPPPPFGTITVRETTDPFDYIPDGIRNTAEVTPGVEQHVELDGYDSGAEFQRGFVWTGQRVVVETNDSGEQLVCFGSAWTDEDVQELLMAENFLYPDGLPPQPPHGTSEWTKWRNNNSTLYDEWQERMAYLPSQGLVLVEMVWNHDILINLPFLQPIVQMFGDPNRIEISVWAAFPVPAAEPKIIYGLP